jgi:hypothetical protein
MGARLHVGCPSWSSCCWPRSEGRKRTPARRRSSPARRSRRPPARTTSTSARRRAAVGGRVRRCERPGEPLPRPVRHHPQLRSADRRQPSLVRLRRSGHGREEAVLAERFVISDRMKAPTFVYGYASVYADDRLCSSAAIRSLRRPPLVRRS